VPKPSTLERNALVNRSCDWHAVDEARMEEIVEASMKLGIANTPTIVTNRRTLCYRDYDVARQQAEREGVPPFYLDVVWHPERDPTATLENLSSLVAVVAAGRLYRIDDLRARPRRECRLFCLTCDQAAGPARRRAGARRRDRPPLAIRPIQPFISG
jgi:hypothetical protein